MKHTATYISRILSPLWLLAATTIAPSCSKEQTEEPPFVQIIGERTEFDFDIAGGIQNFVMYSNYGRWSLVPTYAEDNEWLVIWPAEGVGDARFAIKVDKNSQAAVRQAILNLVVDGTSVATLTFTQAGAAPKFSVNIKESGRSVSYKGETFSVGVNANLGWVAELTNPADAAWVSIGEFTDASQSFTCSINSADVPREAKVTIRAVGTSLYKSFSIHQADRSTSFDLAEKRTIAELLAMAPGKITSNIYVEGSVISDRSTRNYPIVELDNWSNNTLLLDDGTAGLWVEFDDAIDHTANLNDQASIHLHGQTLARDSYTNGLKIDGLSSFGLAKCEAGTAIEPIVIDDLTTLPQYENRLVRLRNVEFVLPYGTLVNINEASGYLGVKQAAKYQGTADYNDLTTEYGHYLRNTQNQITKLYTTWSFTERAGKLIPEGAGDITGIVGKRYKADRYKPYAAVRQREESFCIRVRREADITNYVADPTTRLSKTVMQIGPWSGTAAQTSLMASIGSGQLKHSVGTSVGATAGTSQMYWAWGHVRNGGASFNPETGQWLPAYGNSPAVQYMGVTGQNWWKNTAATLSDTEGCCWILSGLTTSGYTGRLALAFTASSNTEGPIEFQIEWAEQDSDKTWSPIDSPFICANWHCDVHAPEYLFELPDALRNKASFAIRIRASRQRNASDTDNIASGTSRLGIIRISCLN